MSTTESAVIKADTVIETEIARTDTGDLFARVRIGEPSRASEVRDRLDVQLLSNDSTELRRLATNIAVLANNLDRASA